MSSIEEQFEVLYDYFSEDSVESMFNNLPQETLDEVLQVIQLVDKRLNQYKSRIKEMEARMK